MPCSQAKACRSFKAAYLEDIDLDGRILLKWILKKHGWTGFNWLRTGNFMLLFTPSVSINVGNFSNKRPSTAFSRSTRLHETRKRKSDWRHEVRGFQEYELTGKT